MEEEGFPSCVAAAVLLAAVAWVWVYGQTAWQVEQLYGMAPTTCLEEGDISQLCRQQVLGCNWRAAIAGCMAVAFMGGRVAYHSMEALGGATVG